MRYIAVVSLLVATMSAQNAPSANKGRHLDIPAISREANGAVVSIVMADNKGQPIAQGSGFVVTTNGRVVTNYHVIKNGTSAVIKLPDDSFFTVDGVLAFDKDRDIAVIKVHGINFKTVALGDSDRLQVGDEVVAIGSPLSLESTVSNGIVSGIRTEALPASGSLLDQALAQERERKFLQITAPISHGSSGGPLFNMLGQVVGITTAALVGGENLNFAVPINDATKLLRVPASQALLAFPNEPPQAAAAAPEASVPSHGSPSLADTEAWMASSINEARSQSGPLLVDGYPVLRPINDADAMCSFGDFNLIGCGNAHLYAWNGNNNAVWNVRDGRPHVWRSVIYEYTLKFDGCSMSVDRFLETSEVTALLRPALFYLHDPDEHQANKLIYDRTETFDLGKYDPRVTVTPPETTKDTINYSKVKAGDVAATIPKGTGVFGGTAEIKATSRSIPIFLSLSPEFAPRFAKALEHAITLCGGKPESF
jgi:S1-C subfamily serine protease